MASCCRTGVVLRGFAVSGILQVFHSTPELCNGLEQMWFATATDALSRGFLDISARHQRNSYNRRIRETSVCSPRRGRWPPAAAVLRNPSYGKSGAGCKECFRDRLRYPTYVQLEHGQETKRQDQRRPWCCPGVKSPMRPVLEERCSSVARGNPLQTHLLQECQPLWCRKPLGKPHCFSCSGGERADTCEFAKQAMAARKSNALWSAGDPIAGLLRGVHKRRRCRVRVSSRTCSRRTAHTGWRRKTEFCSGFCDMDPL